MVGLGLVVGRTWTRAGCSGGSPVTPWKIRFLTAVGSVILGMSALYVSGADAALWTLAGICWGILFTFIRLGRERTP